MNISGFSAGTLQKMVENNFVKRISNLYDLEDNQEEFIKIPSFEKRQITQLVEKIEKSRTATFNKLLIALDIPLIGRTLSTALSNFCLEDPKIFEDNLLHPELFLEIPGLGEESVENIKSCFQSPDNHFLWNELLSICQIKHNAKFLPITDFFLSEKKWFSQANSLQILE